jgi:TRAP-type C4-dicarboxylate transport system permease small subunit
MRSLLDRIVGGLLALILGGMTILVFASVTLRYVFNNPVTWSEELASLLFAWVTFVGAYVGFRSRSHISIDTLVIFLPPAVRHRVARFVDVCVLLLLALFLWEGTSLTLTTWSLEFPALEISRGYLYLAIPVGAVLMAFGMLESWQKPKGTGQQERP